MTSDPPCAPSSPASNSLDMVRPSATAWLMSGALGCAGAAGACASLGGSLGWIAGALGVGAVGCAIGAVRILKGQARLGPSQGWVSESRKRGGLPGPEDLAEARPPIPWEYDWERACFTWIHPRVGRLGHPLEAWLEPGFFASVIHEDDRGDTLAECSLATEAGLHHILRYRMLCGDGSVVHMEDIVSVNRDAKGRLMLSGVFYDVTDMHARELELERADSELAIQGKRLELALASSDMGSWECVPATGELTFDRRWAQLVGYEPEDLPTKLCDWQERAHPEDAAMVRHAIIAHLKGETQGYSVTYRLKHADGTWRWIWDQGRAVERDSNGLPMRVVGTRQDVTVSKEHALELERLRETAEAASEAKTSFLANVSHEIRTPLTSILGYSEWLEDDLAREGASQEHLEKLSAVLSAGKHLHTILDDVLDLSKIEAGHLQVELLDVEFPDLISGVVDVMRQRAIEKGVRLEVVCATKVPRVVQADPTRLRQVLINLVGNATKFTEQGRIELRLNVGERLRIEVEDTGVGMTETQSRRLFRAFSQGDESVARRFGGTGLGLTISKRLAQLMGGDVELMSTKRGVGTVFRVDLPLLVPKDTEWIAGLEPPAPKGLTAESGQELVGKVLLVEDGTMNRRLIQAILTRAGAEVQSACDGAEGLELFERARDAGEPFDLVVTDIQMPVMDGLAMTRILQMSAPEIPVLALTANALDTDRQRAFDAGCCAYLCKPVDRAALLAECNARLPQQGSRFAA